MIQRMVTSGPSAELRQQRVRCIFGTVHGDARRTPDRQRRRRFDRRRQRGGRAIDRRSHSRRRHLRRNGRVRLGFRLRLRPSSRSRRGPAVDRHRGFCSCARGCFHFTRERSFHCGCNRIANRAFPYCGSDLAATLRADPVEHAFNLHAEPAIALQSHTLLPRVQEP